MAALTIVGGLLRSWSLGRLGLLHFDEGIYAMAGGWALSPHGLAALDSSVVPFAPPGFPILVGLAYALLGVGDLSAIMVSIAMGTLTIPLVGWVAARTFGRGAGAAAATFAALSGPHMAFSRMALTDASFLFFWLLAIGHGQRFLERPGPARAIALGLAVGIAQLFKYNGWIAGVVVVLAAATGAVVRVRDPSAGKQVAPWGWGLAAALVAALVYWPWFRFVESHGGYPALLAHHRGYMGGLSSWPARAVLQLEQDRALSGGVWWMAVSGLAAAAATRTAVGGFPRRPRWLARDFAIGLGLAALCSFFHGALFGAILWMIVFIIMELTPLSKASLVLVVGWSVLALMTPFYYPYARLLLPLQAFSWVLMGGAFAILARTMGRLCERDERQVWGLPKSLLRVVAACWLVPLTLAAVRSGRPATSSLADLLEPSDSLRRACRSIARDHLRPGLVPLRVYARPPVAFYLTGIVPVAARDGLDELFAPDGVNAWALLDAAMVRQAGGMRGRLGAPSDRWELAREVPTTLNWPTLLDIDPSSATTRSPDRSAPLFLFRPKRSGAAR